MDYEADTYTQFTLRGGQRDAYRVAEEAPLCRLRGHDEPYAFEAEHAYFFPMVGWVHLDPVLGVVSHYAEDVATTLEAAYAAQESLVNTAIRLQDDTELDICVHLRPCGRHYQRTPSGYRDVRRLVQGCRSSGETPTLSLPVHKLGETHGPDAQRWRFYTDFLRAIAVEDQVAAVESQSLRVHNMKLTTPSGPAVADLADTAQIEALYGISKKDTVFRRALQLVTSEVVRLAGRAVATLYTEEPVACTVSLCVGRCAKQSKNTFRQSSSTSHAGKLWASWAPEADMEDEETCVLNG